MLHVRADLIMSPSTLPAENPPKTFLKRERGQIGWDAAHEWLRSLPPQSAVTREEIRDWLQQNSEDLASEISETAEEDVFGYLKSQHKVMSVAGRKKDGHGDKDFVSWTLKSSGSKPISAKWRPVYLWLSSLEKNEVVKSREISEWLQQHPETAAAVEADTKRNFVISYVQKTHNRILRSKEIFYSSARFAATPEQGKDEGFLADDQAQHASGYTRRGSYRSSRRADMVDGKELNDAAFESKESVARKLELLDALQTQLQAAIRRLKAEDASLTNSPTETSSGRVHASRVEGGIPKNSVHAWSSSIANPAFGAGWSNANVVNCVWARELSSHKTGAYEPLMPGKCRWKWSSCMEGWNSLGYQSKSLGALFRRKEYSSWSASWCSYTSSGAVAFPQGTVEQAVQKVLDVRFHPGGLPQLACSCNEAPHELLLYDLGTGRATELVGHNSQMQSVEFAFGGERIVSCATNLLKVWDPNTGRCLHTLGPHAGDQNSPGHIKKISAVAVAPERSCLVATCGGAGDDKLLLWNVLSGDMVAHLNAGFGEIHHDTPSMDALTFCKTNVLNLICGSDSKTADPALLQVWDVNELKETLSFPAHDLFITTVGHNPQGTTIISGSGDGTIGLFDMRTGGRITRLNLGHEITSASFSFCGTFFQASCTGNFAAVWDLRLMPSTPASKPSDRPLPAANLNSRSTRALHCLSHGKPMPSIENASQHPGCVDEGDQGVNDARWFHNENVLVTASGNGSIGIWDVSLGMPCLQHIQSHSRCINALAISSDDKYICSGGDDQKVVLYQDMKDPLCCKWRLTHPLSKDLEFGLRRGERQP